MVDPSVHIDCLLGPGLVVVGETGSGRDADVVVETESVTRYVSHRIKQIKKSPLETFIQVEPQIP